MNCFKCAKSLDSGTIDTRVPSPHTVGFEGDSTRNLVEMSVNTLSFYRAILHQYHEIKWTDLTEENVPCFEQTFNFYVLPRLLTEEHVPWFCCLARVPRLLPAERVPGLGGGVRPFIVGGVTCQENSVNERDLRLQTRVCSQTFNFSVLPLLLT
jgi:hypothetical protein